MKAQNKIYLVNEIVTHPENIRTFEEHSLQNLINAPSNYTDYSTKLASFSLSLELSRQILSKYNLFVYLLLPTGEVVIGSKDVELEPCLPNKVLKN